MAKKVVVADDEKKEKGESGGGEVKVKKKRSKCCTCCIAFAVTCLVLCLAVFGVGWYFGDKYSKQYFDMSLGDALGVVNGLYWTKDKDVVSNPYGEDDLDGFYKEIKKNLLLKEDADVDFEAALENAVNEYLAQSQSGGGEGGEGGDKEIVEAKRSTAGGETEENGGNSITDMLIGMVAEVFTRDNIDIERLKGYDEEHDEYIFELKDKQLAAFVAEVLNMVLQNADGMPSFESIAKMIALKDVVALKQITFKAQAVSDEQGNSFAATSCDITLWVGLQKAAGQALTDILTENGVSWVAGLARGAGNMLLPKNFYATVTIPLEDGAEPHLVINDMTGEKRDRLYKIFDGVCANILRNDMSVDSLMTEFTDKIKPYLESAADSINYENADSGTLELDLIDTLVGVASGSGEEGAEENKLEKSDFMYMLQAVLTSSADNRLHELEPYLYKYWYISDGDEKYDHTGANGEKYIDYADKFVEEIENKYSIDFGENATLDDVLAMIGVTTDDGSAVNSEDLLDHLNAERFNASLDKSIDELKLKVTDRMLAAALSGQVDKMLGNAESSSQKLKLDLEALTFVKNPDKPEHTYALVAAEIDIKDILDGGDGNMLLSLAENILPEKMLVSLAVDVTLSLPSGDEYGEAKLVLNDYDKTSRVLDSLAKLIPSFNLDDMSAELETTLRDLVQKLDEKLNIELVPSVADGDSVTPGELIMPDVFTVVASTALDGANVTAEELKSVVKELNRTDGFDASATVGDNYKGFLTDVKSKYYLKIEDENLNTFDDLTNFIMRDGSGDGGSKFDGNMFNIAGVDPTVKYLAYDTREIAELKPRMTADELGALIVEKMPADSQAKKFKVNSVRTSPTSLVVTLSVKISELMPEKVRSLLLSDTVFVTATVDMGEVITDADGEKMHPVSVEINKMDEPTFNAAMRIVEKFGGDFDIQKQVSEFGKIMYTQMQSLKDSLGGADFMRFTDDGIELADFYSFLANKMELKGDPEPALVKRAVQGLYERSAVKALENADNYVWDGSESAEGFVKNKALDASSITADEAMNRLHGEGLTDKEFNGYFTSVLGVNATAVQTIVLANGSGAENAKQTRDWINAHINGEPIASDASGNIKGDYVLVTFRIAMSKFSGSGEMAEGFLPDYVYATVVIKKTDGDVTVEIGGVQTTRQGSTFEIVGASALDGVLFNNMSADEYGLVRELMSIDGSTSAGDTVNINSIANDCMSALNTLGKAGPIIFGVADANGIGTLRSDIGA